VPHHHHYESLHSEREKNSCEKPVHQGHHQNPFQDCHAFNLLVSEKPVSLVKHGQFMVPAGTVPDALHTGFQPVAKAQPLPACDGNNILSPLFLTEMPLRAPPLQV